MVRVLVVDDDKDLLEMIIIMLRANRMEVKSLSGGTALFETLATETPDILLMDIFLGDSDGRELCKQVKKSTAYHRLPVLLYSAGEIAAASIADSNADHFLRKPFEMTHLISQIRARVKQK